MPRANCPQELTTAVNPLVRKAGSVPGAREVELLRGQPQDAQNAFAGIGRHRRRLVDAHGGGRIAQHHVGEGAADIDADAPGSDEGREG